MISGTYIDEPMYKILNAIINAYILPEMRSHPKLCLGV